MKEEEIKEILQEVKAYLKENLSIQIEASIQDYYGRHTDDIEVKLLLDGEEIYKSNTGIC